MISACYQNVLYFIASLCIETPDNVRFGLREDGEQVVKLRVREWREDVFEIL